MPGRPEQCSDLVIGCFVGDRCRLGKPVPGPETVLPHELFELAFRSQRFQRLVKDGQRLPG